MPSEPTQSRHDEAQPQESGEDAELQELLQSLLISGLSTPDDLRRVGFHDHELRTLTMPQTPAAEVAVVGVTPRGTARATRKRTHDAGQSDKSRQEPASSEALPCGRAHGTSERARAAGLHDAAKAERSAALLRAHNASHASDGNTALRFTGLEASVVRAIATELCAQDSAATDGSVCVTSRDAEADNDEHEDEVPLVYRMQ